MTTVASERIVIDAVASNFAFQAGQTLETLLLDRGAEVARKSGSTLVTAEHILAGADDDFIDQVRNQLSERAKRASGKAA